MLNLIALFTGNISLTDFIPRSPYFDHLNNCSSFPKVDDSGNVARIVLGLKFVFLNNWQIFGKILTNL